MIFRVDLIAAQDCSRLANLKIDNTNLLSDRRGGGKRLRAALRAGRGPGRASRSEAFQASG
jgi:hypothetical protein